jgi:hypothetical protein
MTMSIYQIALFRRVAVFSPLQVSPTHFIAFCQDMF